MLTALSLTDSTPSTSTGPSSSSFHFGSLEKLAASSRTTPIARSMSTSRATPTSTTARDQPRVLLLTTLISPFGTTCITP